MRLSAPLTLQSLLDVSAYLRRLVQSIGTSWDVNHEADGTHKFPWVDIPRLAEYCVGLGTSVWTVNAESITVSRYQMIGTTMRLNLEVNDSDVGTGDTYLSYRLPDNYVVAARMQGPFRAVNAGVVEVGWWVAIPNERVVRLKSGAATWTSTAANDTSVFADVTIEVRKD